MLRQRTHVSRVGIILSEVSASWGHSWMRWQKSFLKPVNSWISKLRVRLLTCALFDMAEISVLSKCHHIYFFIFLLQKWTKCRLVYKIPVTSSWRLARLVLFTAVSCLLGYLQLLTTIFWFNRIMKIKNWGISNLWRSAKRKMKWSPSSRLL